LDLPVAYVINLDRRTDRWQAIEKTCRDAGLAPERISAVQAEPGWVGCGRSHQKCVELARAQGLENVLILEDDAVFDARSIERFRAILAYLADRGDWDRFSGGLTFGSGSLDPGLAVRDAGNRLFSAAGFCTHFDLINRRAYDFILSWNGTPEHGPIDAYYLRAGQKNIFRTLCTVPHIAVQSDSMSDVTHAPASMSEYFAYSSSCLSGILKEHVFGKFSSGQTGLSAPPAGVEVRRASHPHWSGHLYLSPETGLLVFAEAGSLATFRADGHRLTVEWFDSPKEEFVWAGGQYVLASPPRI